MPATLFERRTTTVVIERPNLGPHPETSVEVELIWSVEGQADIIASRHTFRPHKLTVRASLSGVALPRFYACIDGKRVRQDGTVGHRDAYTYWYGRDSFTSEAPLWAWEAAIPELERLKTSGV